MLATGEKHASDGWGFLVCRFVDGVLTPVSGRSLWLYEMRVESTQLQPGTYLNDDDFKKYRHAQQELNSAFFGHISRYSCGSSAEKAINSCPVLPSRHMELRRFLNRLSFETRLTSEGKLGDIFHGHAI